MDSDGYQSIDVYMANGRPALGPSGEFTENDDSTRQSVQIVRIPLHHRFTLGKVFGLVVYAGDARLLVRELGLYVVLVETVFIEHR